jgi:hypothetical protein
MTWVMIEAPTLKAMIDKLDGDALLAKPLRQAMEKARDLVEKRARAQAPGGQGHSIDAGISSSIDAKPVPLWAKVSFVSPVRGSFPYGYALEGSKRYHYRTAGPIGKPTRGWFKSALTASRKEIDALLTTALEEIKAAWQK